QHFGGSAARIHRDLGAGGDVAALFESGADAEAVARLLLTCAPAELVRGGENHSAQTLVGRVLQAEIEGVHFDRVGQLVHPALADKVVGGGGEPAIRTLPKRRARLMELLLLSGNVIRRLQATRS